MQKNNSAVSPTMPDEFPDAVLLSGSANDTAVVRSSTRSASIRERAGVRCRTRFAERLRADGVKVWLDEWVLKPGDSIPSKIEEGLGRSRVLLLCMSVNAFGSDWAQLEPGTFRTGHRPFRDPLNKERRFLPLRVGDDLVYNTQISVCLWFLAKSKAADSKRDFREIPAQTPFIDARKLGTLTEHVHRERNKLTTMRHILN